ncbi:Uncharacterized protein BP5553_04163 [Venustampulla echinocandica]|uniref:WD40 repeat-like protein n=1 Tax=Venustampulla echinocandica TaxID=2656787 RepID=A0A370TWB7_9HELO|nr:Uncharacterized protein BP5553_04163 [Venustampulla echinocandica]RDL39823.1 Uncharacterized protein BP5553_04163 [Venustampulla echinocandica]
MEPDRKLPKLVASTGSTYNCTVAESRVREGKLLNSESQDREASIGIFDDDLEVNYFKSAQWTPDGTSLLTSNADNTVRTFIVPPDLLDNPACPISLTPYTVHTYPTPINCLTPYPYFALSDPATTLYLSTQTDLPIRLANALSPSPSPTATYPLVSPTTEAYYAPSSLLWSAGGTSFLAGTDCLIALFDVSRSGEGPMTRLPTIPSKRHKMKGGGVGMRGIVSALSLQPSAAGEDSILAAGTWTRWVGLYDAAGMGGTVATWSVAEAADTHAGIGGLGVTQTLWSACGRYLYVVERKSRGVLVYDVRGAKKMLAWLEGRMAETNQRLGVDCFESEGGTEVWAAGTDGIVRVWEGVGKTEGAVGRDWEWKAHDDPVTSTAVHSSGTVVATCSGQKTLPSVDGSDSGSDDESSGSDSDDDSEESENSSCSAHPTFKTPDNSIKVWSL